MNNAPVSQMASGGNLGRLARKLAEAKDPYEYLEGALSSRLRFFVGCLQYSPSKYQQLTMSQGRVETSSPMDMTKSMLSQGTNQSTMLITTRDVSSNATTLPKGPQQQIASMPMLTSPRTQKKTQEQPLISNVTQSPAASSLKECCTAEELVRLIRTPGLDSRKQYEQLAARTLASLGEEERRRVLDVQQAWHKKTSQLL